MAVPEVAVRQSQRVYGVDEVQEEEGVGEARTRAAGSRPTVRSRERKEGDHVNKMEKGSESVREKKRETHSL